VTVEEALSDPELEAEIREECSKNGAVELVKVVPNEAANSVRVFVLFAVEGGVGEDPLKTAAASAERARASLHSRYFSGRVVTGTLYDDSMFLAGNFLA